jgi:hypothetical protein
MLWLSSSTPRSNEVLLIYQYNTKNKDKLPQHDQGKIRDKGTLNNTSWIGEGHQPSSGT